MATSPNLPLGAFITTLGGKRCTALPRTDVSSTIQQTSTTTTSLLSFSSASTSSTSAAQVLLPPPQVQTSVLQTIPPPAVATTSSSSSSAFLGQSSTIISAPQIVSSAFSPAVSSSTATAHAKATTADTSVAALSTTSSSSTLAATTSQVAVPPQSEVAQTQATTATPFTTIGIASGLAATSTQSQSSGSTTTVVAIPSSGSRGNGNGSTTAAVAGGVIGGVAVVSLVAFFIWFWRRRVLKRRRSTLLTPLSADPSFGTGFGGPNEKRSYFRRDSANPTTRSTQVKTALRTQYGRVRGRFDTLARSASVHSTSSHGRSRSVDMNRGNSQFMDNSPIVGHERKGSLAPSTRGSSDTSIKERIMEVWGRFRGSRQQDSGRVDRDRNDIFAARGIDGGMKEKQTPRARPLTNKPDFLTLLNMDDGELDREAQRRRISRTRGGSEGSGVGGLSLDFGGNPFSDANALAFSNPRAAPPVASGANNPFSDANAIKAPPQPSTYVNDIRRSRNQSFGGSMAGFGNTYDLQGLRVANGASRPPSGATGAGPHESFYPRDSTTSFESFTTKRDKFRSDPFDLEQLSESIPGSFNLAALAMPPAVHTRNISNGGSSKYSSGISTGSLDEWSDPGPDVGPAVNGKLGDASGSGSRRKSQGGSVKMGYAM